MASGPGIRDVLCAFKVSSSARRSLEQRILLLNAQRFISNWTILIVVQTPDIYDVIPTSATL